jgi:hypothetical protein
MPLCREDLLVCIDWLALAIGDFLKDWVTMGCLAVLLVILLRERARQQDRKLAAYARTLLDYDQARNDASARATWKIGDDAASAAGIPRRPPARSRRRGRGRP